MCFVSQVLFLERTAQGEIKHELVPDLPWSFQLSEEANIRRLLSRSSMVDSGPNKFFPQMHIFNDHKLVLRKENSEDLSDLIDGQSSLVLVRDHQLPDAGDFGQNSQSFNKLVVSLLQGETSTDDELNF